MMDEAVNKTLYYYLEQPLRPSVPRKFITDKEWKSGGQYQDSLANRCISLLGIRKPDVMNHTKSGDRRYINLWSMEYDDKRFYTIPNDNEVVKTIYDPCPAGFHLPPSNTFTGFTTTGSRQFTWRVTQLSSISKLHLITGGCFTVILTEAAI
ncbi:MAG: hypothetical protein V8S95_10895 [Odoribacter sp.]